MKLVFEAEPGVLSETEVARIERDELAVPKSLGLTFQEAEQMAAAMQTQVVGAQVAIMGERFRSCEHCGTKLVSKGYYPATFRSLFGNIGLRVRQLSACRCRAGLWSRGASRHCRSLAPLPRNLRT